MIIFRPSGLEIIILGPYSGEFWVVDLSFRFGMLGGLAIGVLGRVWAQFRPSLQQSIFTQLFSLKDIVLSEF